MYVYFTHTADIVFYAACVYVGPTEAPEAIILSVIMCRAHVAALHIDISDLFSIGINSTSMYVHVSSAKRRDTMEPLSKHISLNVQRGSRVGLVKEA